MNIEKLLEVNKDLKIDCPDCYDVWYGEDCPTTCTTCWCECGMGTLSLKEKYRILQSARTEFRIDHYQRFYRLKEAGLFQKAKTFLIFRHFEIFLILFGTLYCKKG